MAAPGDLASAGVMLIEPVAASDWLVIAPVVTAIVFGAVLLMLRHHLRWQVAVAAGGLLLMLAANAGLLCASCPMARW